MNGSPPKNGNRTAAPPLRPDQMAPHSVESEEAVLGSILLNPDCWYQVSGFLKKEDFFIVRNEWVWEAVQRLKVRNDLVDYITVVEELKAQGRLTEIGGAAYITYLVNHTASSIYAETYGRIVERAAVRRRMLNAASQIARLAHEESAAIEDIKNDATKVLFEAVENVGQRKTVSARVIAEKVKADVETAYQASQDNRMIGMPTGFTDLDQLMGGLQKSDLIIVAGRPGMGKTSWMLSAALNAMRNGGARPAVFSLEMSETQVIQRFAAMDTGVSTDKLRTGRLTPDEKKLIDEGLDRIGKLPLFINETKALPIVTWQMECRRLFQEYGINLIMVDYVQLMVGSKYANANNRTLEIGEITAGLKQIAGELNVPVLAAAQLNRDVEQRQDKRPGLSDLRESGSIENDADIVMFLYRDDYYNENTQRPNQADVIIAKHRNGPCGSVALYFRKEMTRFSNLYAVKVDLAGYGDTETNTKTKPKPSTRPTRRTRQPIVEKEDEDTP